MQFLLRLLPLRRRSCMTGYRSARPCRLATMTVTRTAPVRAGGSDDMIIGGGRGREGIHDR